MALRGDAGFLTEDFLQQFIENEGRRIAAMKPDTPLSRYGIEASRILRDSCVQMIEGAGTVDDLLRDALRQQRAAADRHGVTALL